MPVTAKLSRRVYEQLGDDVANAIVEWFNAMDATYRADLRELNDLNFARFDAKVGERFAQFEARIGERFAQSEATVAERFAHVEAKFAERFAHVEATVAERFAHVEATVAERFAHVEATVAERFAQVAERFAQVEARFERLEVRIDNCVDRATFEQRLSGLEVRLTKKLYGVSTVALLAQTAILIGLLKFFATR